MHMNWLSWHMTNVGSGKPLRAIRRAVNETLPEALIQAAEAPGIDISQACENAPAALVPEVWAAAWLLENRAAINAWN
jgi:post-segregation antitoxin (ccd killing protein)